MMQKILLYVLISVAFISCEKKYRFIIDSPEKIKINEKLAVSIKEKNNYSFDSVSYFLDEKQIYTNPSDISNFNLGKHLIKAKIFYNNESKIVEKPIYFYADKAPKIYNFKVIKSFPHDASAYTQGLELHNGVLYESTGQYGLSSLRKVELKTGKIIQNIDIPVNYFAEGLTIFDNKIYQLTWRENIGFIYELSNLNQIKTFQYNKSKEGWGLTHDENFLIKSDGTEKLWFLDPLSLKEIKNIEVYTDAQNVEQLNELEYVNEKIYANVYLKNIMLIINPKNGMVEGVVDFNDLAIKMKQEQPDLKDEEVLNGIAFDKTNNKLYVTGKNWSKLYEIEIF